ncbi:hypothetical protein INT46_008893 [Mucor plumbeus]|uniref:Uncharacterized protein n=1 Tax=Mucor plumbeus TaxID=97098 RepID=A0A8H7UND3_9FUNG|nr:hypothetical protein INT46_008893 [Mucor plumbeus]
MNLIEKFKANFDIWKIEKYTKRREFLPEYKSKDLDYYKEVYCEGTYSGESNTSKATSKFQSRIRKRASSIFSMKATSGGITRTLPLPPCSETYNQKN